MENFDLKVGQMFLSTGNYYKIIVIEEDAVFFTSTDSFYKPTAGNIIKIDYDFFLELVADNGKNLIN